MGFWVLTEKEEYDILHGSHIVLWTFTLVISQQMLCAEMLREEFGNEVS